MYYRTRNRAKGLGAAGEFQPANPQGSFLERLGDYLGSLWAYRGIEAPPSIRAPGAPINTTELTVSGQWTPDLAIAAGWDASLQTWQEFMAQQDERNKVVTGQNWLLISGLVLGAIILVKVIK